MPPSERIMLNRDCEVIQIPSGIRSSLPAGTSVRVTQSLGGSYTLATEHGGMYRLDIRDIDALGRSSPATPDLAHQEGTFREEMIREQLKTVYDPEIPVSVVDLGLIYSSVTVPLPDGGKKIEIKMSMTAPGCGMGNVLKADVESKLLRLPEVKEVDVEVVFDPPWHPGLMSEAAKLQLGFDSDYGAPPSTRDPFKIVG
jgi:probable FeS assembly SUF system protein SufT